MLFSGGGRGGGGRFRFQVHRIVCAQGSRIKAHATQREISQSTVSLMCVIKNAAGTREKETQKRAPEMNYDIRGPIASAFEHEARKK